MESLRLDKGQLESSLRSTITALKEQLDELQVRFETTCAALQNEENTTQLLKENLAEIVAEKEKTIQTLTLEHEQLRSAFEAEKNRAASSEQELKAVMHTKTQSEQELALIITGLNETKQQQTADITRLKGRAGRRILPADSLQKTRWNRSVWIRDNWNHRSDLR